MRVARHIIFIVCLALAGAGAVLTARQHLARPEDRASQVVFWAVLLLAGAGALGFVLQFFAQRAARVVTCLFFGFLAGLMATNFVTDVASSVTFTSVTGYLVNYGLELLFVALPVVGTALFLRARDKAVAEANASPNASSATLRPGNSADARL
jgi:uncharacterized membrane protein YoaK (UPF0700 family)